MMVNNHINSKASDFNNISDTAILCADARAKYTDMPYVREIWNVLEREGQGKNGEMISPRLQKMIQWIPSIRHKVSLLEGRYLSMGDAIDNSLTYMT